MSYVFINHQFIYESGIDLKDQLSMRKLDLAFYLERIAKRSIQKREIYDLFYNLDIGLLILLARTIRGYYRSGPITYSRKVFINLVNLCRDTCSYCTYKKEPRESGLSMLNPDKVIEIAELGKKFHCTEALIVTGESPEQKYSEVRNWLKTHGCCSTIEYVDKVSDLILKKTGLLPHTNAGTLSVKELAILRLTNVSLGCMLESSSGRLAGRNMPHEYAPSKNPRARRRTLENAGRLKIPITTGLLIGIGENSDEILESLFMLKDINDEYGNIQEVIIQNFVPKSDTPMRNIAGPPLEYLIRAIAISRIILPDMNIQVPPNLNPIYFGNFLNCGINDWGGISPVTIDHVNPESPWPKIEDLTAITEHAGHRLRPRLPVYPEFIIKGRDFINDNLWQYVRSLSGPDGLVREEYLK
jgi:FO synthase subunit 1